MAVENCVKIMDILTHKI